MFGKSFIYDLYDKEHLLRGFAIFMNEVILFLLISIVELVHSIYWFIYCCNEYSISIKKFLYE